MFTCLFVDARTCGKAIGFRESGSGYKSKVVYSFVLHSCCKSVTGTSSL